MQQPRLSPAIALMISIQMIIAPLPAMAEAQAPQPTTTGRLNSALQTAGQIYNSVRGTNQAPANTQFQSDMQKLAEFQNPKPDIYFNRDTLLSIPGMKEYLALHNVNPAMMHCNTLETTISNAYAEVCQIGVSTTTGAHQQAQVNEATSYYNQYLQISKQLENFNVDQTNTAFSGFGASCMNNAMKHLKAFFEYQSNELDRRTTQLQDEHAAFLKANEGIFNEILDTTAVLDGSNSGLPKGKLEFDKQFANPACKSMMAGEAFNKLGTAGGLNQINSSLKDAFSTGSPDLSGESYLTNHAEVMKDMESLANKVAQQVELNFSEMSSGPGGYSGFVQRLNSSVSSAHPVKLDAPMFADLQSKFKSQNDDLTARTIALKKELGDNAGGAFEQLQNLNAKGFDLEVANIENRLKNQCLQRSLTGTSSVDSIVERINKSNISGFANQNASNELRIKIKKIFENTNSTLEQKQSELAAVSTKGSEINNDRPYQRKEVIDGKVVDITVAAGKAAPTDFIHHAIKDCQIQFTHSTGNTMPAATAIQNLKKLNQDYKSLSKSHSNEVRKEIRRKLIECDGPSIANNTIAGSCKPELFDTNRSGFCTNAALSCSKNMHQCTEMAEKITSNFKKKRELNFNAYKDRVEGIKRKMDQNLKAARHLFDGQVVPLRGMFGVGFEPPTNMEMEVPEGARYNAKLKNATARSPDGPLLLENPTEYLEMYKRNITKLKQSLKSQQDKIVTKLDDRIKNTKAQYDKNKEQAERHYKECDDKRKSFIQNQDQANAQAQADQQKKMQELGEKRDEFCSEYGMAQDNPGAACSENIAEITKNALKSANTPEARQTILEYRRHCNARRANSDRRDAKEATWSDLCTTTGSTGKLDEKKFTPNKLIPNEATWIEIREYCIAHTAATEKCQDRPVVTGASETRCYKADDLKSMIESSYYNMMRDNDTTATAQQPTLDPQPAFCAAGDNSNRGSDDKPVNNSIPGAILQGIQQGRSGAAN